MSGRSLQVAPDSQQDAKFPAPNPSHLALPQCLRRHLTSRHSFQTSPTRVARSKARRKAFAHNDALTPMLAGERSIPHGQELEETEFLFPFVDSALYQQPPRPSRQGWAASQDNKDLGLVS